MIKFEESRHAPLSNSLDSRNLAVLGQYESDAWLPNRRISWGGFYLFKTTIYVLIGVDSGRNVG